jgi:hypothetical protein
MAELLRGGSGEWLAGDAYQDDFGRAFWQVTEPGFWKLERLQSFQEPGNESWLAFINGDWAESLRLAERQRPALADYYRKIAESDFTTWRVRVVERPITPYVQWELNSLRIWAEYGERIRVVSAEQIASAEENGRLPELVTLGTEVMYQVRYDHTGLPEGGIRYVDRELIGRCQRFIADLYSVGEELDSFFEREVAALPPPLWV